MPYGRNPFGFQGLQHDTEAGLIYNRARMYDPASGRFNQRDPLGYPDGMNTYAPYHVLRGTLDPWGLDDRPWYVRTGQWLADRAPGTNLVPYIMDPQRAVDTAKEMAKPPLVREAADAAKDYVADRKRGEDIAQSVTNAVGKNTPGMNIGWETCEAATGKRKGGADHDQPMTAEERADAFLNLASYYGSLATGAWANKNPTTQQSGPVHWVDENASMRENARRYDAGAQGSRSNAATRQSQAPALDYTRADGSSAQCRFDGFDDGSGVLIDRKRSVVTTEKARNQALRQSEALRQNGYTGLWEVPTQTQANRAHRMFDDLGVDNIEVRVVPEQ